MQAPPAMTNRAPLFALALLLAAAAPARAITLLTTGKVAVFRSPAGAEATALVRVGADRAFHTLRDPRCPTPSSLRFALSRRGADFENHKEGIDLPCENWRAAKGAYRYLAADGAPGGVRDILYSHGKLIIRAGGASYRPVVGPVAYVEAWLTIGDEVQLVRFQNFRQNDAESIVTRRPSASAAAGEAAFWDTVWADHPRSDQALRLLTRAVRHDPRDGRSQFLLGMLHLYRGTQACAQFDFRNLCDDAKAEGFAAQEPLDRASELLAADTRVPGFRAATSYGNGYERNDPAELALGMQQLETAIDSNPLFDSFDAFAVVAPILPASDPYYQNRILPLVDFVFSQGSCLVTLPETCTNAGMAPHNFEGTMLLLGDIYVKGGRAGSAEPWYRLGQSFGESTGYRYEAALNDRVEHLAERAALYQDADPTNDPPLIGGGCVYCHNK
jgi:hypothetical protein